MATAEWRGEEARRRPASSGSRGTRGQAKRKAAAAQARSRWLSASGQDNDAAAHSTGYSSWLLAFLNLEFLVVNIGSKNQGHNVFVVSQ